MSYRRIFFVTLQVEKTTGYAAEEFLASLATGKEQGKIWNGMLSKIKEALRSIPFLQNLRFSDREIKSALNRAFKAMRKPSAGTLGNNGNTSFAMRVFNEEKRKIETKNLEDFSQKYNQIIQKFEDGTLQKSEQFDLGKTPDAFTMLGVEQLPVSMSGNLFFKAKEKHGLGVDELRQIPESLYNPVMIFDSSDRSSNPDGMVVLTQIHDSNGKPVVIALNIGKKQKKHFVNDVSSIHGRDAGQILGWIEDGFLRYSHKKRALALARFHRLQLPRKATVSERRSNTIIDESQDVKLNSEKKAKFSVAPPVDSENFKRWFKDSKVVDENGKPIVVYHGTDYKFTVFKARENQEFFFTNDKNAAQDYGEIQMPVFLQMQNPYVIDLNGEGDAAIYDAIDYAHANGQDGVIAKNAYDGANTHTEYVVFESTQIKSATNNNGDYDPENPDINRKAGKKKGR